MDDLKKEIENVMLGNHGQRYQGYELMGQQGLGNPLKGFNQVSKSVVIGPDHTTISQALTRQVERREATIKQLQSEIKELSELRDALTSVKHFPMHLLRSLFG